MRRIHNTLSGALKNAVKGGLIPRNPAPDAELPKAIQPKVKVWPAEQLGAFLDAIEGQRLYPLYHLAAFAGMRRGELCGISWDDVDLDAGKITVRWQIGGRTYRAAKAAEKRGERGEYRTKPKTRAGEDRVVDLDQLSVKVLRTWRKQQAAERLEWGPAYIDPVDGDPYNLLFTREDGSPLDPGQTYLTFVRLVKDAGLSHLKLHGLRHINISLQLDAGVSETIIAMRVGHASPGADPIDLRAPHRYRREAGRGGHRLAGPTQSQGHKARKGAGEDQLGTSQQQDPQHFPNNFAPKDNISRWP